MTSFRGRIKPLDWIDHNQFLSSAYGMPEVVYHVRSRPDKIYVFALRPERKSEFKSIRAAKAACQRDHDARVKALLIIEGEK